MPKKEDVNIRFWRRVQKMETCWLWTGYQQKFGYGIIGREGKTILTHRLSWEIHRGEIPNGLCVLHVCDVPQCVNPSHLFLGDRPRNIQDCISKGRALKARGTRHHKAKLKEREVLQIRKLKGQQSTRDLSARYGVSMSTIQSIQKGKTWGHL